MCCLRIIESACFSAHAQTRTSGFNFCSGRREKIFWRISARGGLIGENRPLCVSRLSISELLARFTASRCGEAFRELVTRYSGFVMAVALRQTAGDTAAAEDVVQEVFTGLARESRRVRGETLGAWLHRRTVFVAAHWRRGELRRRKREAAAAEMRPGTSARAVPEGFDEAFARLREADQQLLLWHYVEDTDYRSIGERLGISDDAAQKRTARALEQLRALLTKCGALRSGTALTAIMLAAAGREPVSGAQQAQWAAAAVDASAQTKWAAAGFALPAACIAIGVAVPLAFPRAPAPSAVLPPQPVASETSGGTGPRSAAERAPEPPVVYADLAALLSATEKAEHSALWAARLDRTVSGFTAAQCRGVMEEIGYDRDNSGQASRFLYPLRKKIVARWAEAAPADAVQHLRDGEELTAAFRIWGGIDFAAAERGSVTVLPPPHNSAEHFRLSCWSAALSGLAETDFEGAIQRLLSRPPSPGESNPAQRLHSFLCGLAERIPAAVAKYAVSHDCDDYPYVQALRTLVRREPRLAWSLMRKRHPPNHWDRELHQEVLINLSGTDSAFAVRNGPAILGDRASRFADRIVTGLKAAGFEKAWEEIEKCPPGEWRESLVQALGRKFAWEKPKEALAKFKAAEAETSGLWWKALRSLASMDAEAALAVPIPPNARPDYLWSIAQTLNAKDPVRTAQWLAALPDTFQNEVQEARDMLARQVASDPAAQAKAAAAQGDDAQQMKTLSAALPQWYKRDPQAAAAFAHTLKGDARLAAFASIAAAARVRSPSQLASAQQMLEEVAAQQTPLPQEVRSGIWNFTANWTRDDPEAASAWMNSLPRGPAFDQAASGLIRSLYQSDAAEALVWAAAIGDDTARAGASDILIQDWSMADNDDCRAAIESLDAPEAVKAGFLKLMRPEQP